MKKLTSILVVLIVGIGSVLAQGNYKAIKGFVIDKNGNPIPGAEVMAPGGGESTITDVDGSFSMNVPLLLKKLTATYDGMNSKTLKLKSDQDLIFTLKKERKHPAFINLLFSGGYSFWNGETFRGGAGIMGGMLGKWGFYGKFMAEGFVDYADLYPSFTAGVIKSIYKRSSFLYLGIGYGSGLEDYYSDYYHTDGCAIDFGFIFKTAKHFNVSAGISTQSDFIDFITTGIQVGVGYVF